MNVLFKRLYLCIAIKLLRIILFHQFTYVETEEKLLDKVGLLEDDAKNDVKGGEATRLGIEGGVIVLSGVFLGEGIPEAVELLQGHVEDVLHPLHGSVNVADEEEVTNVEHGVAIRKAIQVNPIVIRSGLDDVPRLKVAVYAMAVLRYTLDEGA